MVVIDPILLSHILAISVFGDWRWVEVGREVLFLFLEIEHFLGKRLTCVVYAGMSMTLFVFLRLMSKLVCCCAVLCGNFDVRDGKSIGNLLDDN